MRRARTTAVLVAAPFLVFASSLAQTHVHASAQRHDHAIAHSHFSPHHPVAHEVEGPEIEHDDELVLWVDSPVLPETAYRGVAILPAVPCDSGAIRF